MFQSKIITSTYVGGVLYSYSQLSHCAEVEYRCGDYETTAVTLTIPEGFPSGKLILYYGLSGFYSAYMALKSSYSSVQLSAPRAAANLPYTSCDPVQKLSDLKNVANPYVAIDAFATSRDWRASFDLTDVSTRTLRPCGALYYWVLTDDFSLFNETGEQVPLSTTSPSSWDTLGIPSEPHGQAFPYIDSVTGEFVWADPSTDRFRAWARSNIGSDLLVKNSEISEGLAPGTYTVRVTSCRDLDAGKFVRVCNASWVGTRSVFLSALFFACGSIIVVATIAFILMSYRRPL